MIWSHSPQHAALFDPAITFFALPATEDAQLLVGAGGPGMWVPLSSMLSFIGVLPLVLLAIEATSTIA